MHITPQQQVETGIPSNRRDNLKQICMPGADTVPLVQTACTMATITGLRTGEQAVGADSPMRTALHLALLPSEMFRIIP